MQRNVFTQNEGLNTFCLRTCKQLLFRGSDRHDNFISIEKRCISKAIAELRACVYSPSLSVRTGIAAFRTYCNVFPCPLSELKLQKMKTIYTHTIGLDRLLYGIGNKSSTSYAWTLEEKGRVDLDDVHLPGSLSSVSIYWKMMC